MRLREKVALVTGASRGIGRAITTRFAKEGAQVMLCARSEAPLRAAAEELKRQGGKVHAFPLDIADPSEVQACVTETLKVFGRIDVLVNNAGITRDGLLPRVKGEDWHAVLQTNLDSLFYFTKAVYRVMLKQRSGRIVNLSSVVALKGNPGQSVYATTKAGIIGFSKCIAQELAARGITVNVIAPGFIDTDMTGTLTDEVKKIACAQIPMGKFGTPDDIAQAALFLASDEAAYITGQVLHVNGGLLMV